MNLAIREIVSVLKKHYGYDYGEEVKVLKEMLRVFQNFKKFSENPEKYQGKCPKEI